MQETSAAPQQEQELGLTGDELFANTSVPAVERAQIDRGEGASEGQPDDPLKEALDFEGPPKPQSLAPAPPAEIDWLDDPPAKEPLDNDAPSEPARTALAAWRMGSKWSLAAAYFGKGLGPERYGESLEQAEYAARLLDVQLPAFSQVSNDANLQSATAAFLLEEAAPRLVEQVSRFFPTDHSALVELALKTHSLLLIYTPRSEGLDSLIADIRRAAENSALAEDVWRELIDLLEQRAEFAKVKLAVFELHQRATAELGDSAAK